MPLISTSIPNLINGISQQPFALRLASQAEAQQNCYSSVVEGLRKRPPTEYVAQLKPGVLTAPFMHTINRDLDERYIMVVSERDIDVYDLDGNQKTVNFTNHTDTCQSAAVANGDGTAFQIYQREGSTSITLTTTGTFNASAVWEKSATGAFAGEEITVRNDLDAADTGVAAWTAGDWVRCRINSYSSGSITATVVSDKANYLVSAGAQRDSFDALTIADHTFIANKEVIPAMDAATLSTDFGEEYLVYVKSQASAAYANPTSLTVDGTTITPTFDADQVDYAENIRAAMAANGTINAGFTFSRERSTIRIKKDTGAAFEMKFNNARQDHMQIFKKTTQRFSDLPTVAPAGMVIEVIGDATSNFDNYYVKFVTTNPTATFDVGVWEETVARGIETSFNVETMPHILVRESDGTFTYETAVWNTRQKGDLLTAPDPSFIGFPIQSIAFYKNRVVFLADTNVIMSEAGEFFNFFPTTVTTILDTAPIDVATSGSSGDGISVPILRWAVPFDKSLLIFSDQTQFTLSSGSNILTPTTVEVNVTTEFETGSLARPVNAGKNMYFPANDGDFTRVREYFVDGDSGKNDAADVTAHCPKYVPKDVRSMAVSTVSDIMCCLSNEDQTRVYIYKYFWSNNEKLQSSWSFWSFNGVEVLDITILANTLYLTTQHDDAVYLMKMDLAPGRVDSINSPYLTHLDRRVDESQCTVAYDAGTNRTTFTMPYVPRTLLDLEGEEVEYRAVTRTVTSEVPGVVMQNLEVDGSDIIVDGDQQGVPLYIGERYLSRYTFSTQVLKELGSGNTQQLIGEGRIQVRTLSIIYSNTGWFEVGILHNHTGVLSEYGIGPSLGTVEATIGTPWLHTGVFKVPVLGKNDEVVMTVDNDTHLPMHLLSAEWEGFYSIRSKRYKAG